ncbi:MAG: hypothetical protein U9O53_04805, partial [archaeon]|nr:hypothetical protein [archaeon]
MKNNTLSVDIIISEFNVENMDMRWLAEHAENKIDTSDLNNYAEGILSELYYIVDILPKVGMFNEKEQLQLSKNLYQLAKSFVYNSQIFQFAGKLSDLYN